MITKKYPDLKDKIFAGGLSALLLALGVAGIAGAKAPVYVLDRDMPSQGAHDALKARHENFSTSASGRIDNAGGAANDTARDGASWNVSEWKAPVNEFRNASSFTAGGTFCASQGGQGARVRFQAGMLPLKVHSAYMGRTFDNGSTIAAGTHRRLTFDGKTSMTLPPHTMAFSDPVYCNLTTGAYYSVRGYYTGMVEARSKINGGWKEYGNASGKTGKLAIKTAPPGGYGNYPVYAATGMDVLRPGSAASRSRVLVLGDSISSAMTGWAMQLNAMEDVCLAARDNNRASFEALGFQPNSGDLTHRPTGAAFDSAIVMLGTNDINQAQTDAQVKDNLTKIFFTLKSQGVKVVAATIIPRNAFTATQETYRVIVNTWLMHLAADGVIDGVADFDKAVRDAANPATIAAVYDSGDGVHPNQAGNDAMFAAYFQMSDTLHRFRMMRQANYTLYLDSVSGKDVCGYGFAGATPIKTLAYALQVMADNTPTVGVTLDFAGGTVDSPYVYPGVAGGTSFAAKNIGGLALSGKYGVMQSANPATVSAHTMSDAVDFVGHGDFAGSVCYVVSGTTGTNTYQVVQAHGGGSGVTLFGNFNPVPSADCVVEFRKPTVKIDCTGAGGVSFGYIRWPMIENVAVYNATGNSVSFTTIDTVPTVRFCQILPAAGGTAVSQSNNQLAKVDGSYISGGAIGGSGYINLTGSGITGSSTSGIQLSRTFHQTNITKSGIYMCATGVLADYGAVNIYGTRSDSYISYCTNYGVKATDGGRAYVSGVSYSNNLPADTYTDTGYGSVIN